MLTHTNQPKKEKPPTKPKKYPRKDPRKQRTEEYQELKPRQQLFLDTFFLTSNASKSYITAGYKAQGAAVTASASNVLHSDGMQKALRAESVIRGWTPERIRTGIAEIALRDDTRTSDKLKAYDMLAKIQGLYDVAVSDTRAFQFNIILPGQPTQVIDVVQPGQLTQHTPIDDA